MWKSQKRESLIPTETPRRPCRTYGWNRPVRRRRTLVCNDFSKYPFVRRISPHNNNTRTMTWRNDETNIQFASRPNYGQRTALFRTSVPRIFSRIWSFHHIPATRGKTDSETSKCRDGARGERWAKAPSSGNLSSPGRGKLTIRWRTKWKEKSAFQKLVFLMCIWHNLFSSHF